MVFLLCCHFHKKVVLRLNEHGDVIDMLYLCDMHNNLHITQRFLEKLGPCRVVMMFSC